MNLGSWCDWAKQWTLRDRSSIFDRCIHAFKCSIQWLTYCMSMPSQDRGILVRHIHPFLSQPFVQPSFLLNFRILWFIDIDWVRRESWCLRLLVFLRVFPLTSFKITLWRSRAGRWNRCLTAWELGDDFVNNSILVCTLKHALELLGNWWVASSFPNAHLNFLTKIVIKIYEMEYSFFQFPILFPSSFYTHLSWSTLKVQLLPWLR